MEPGSTNRPVASMTSPASLGAVPGETRPVIFPSVDQYVGGADAVGGDDLAAADHTVDSS